MPVAADATQDARAGARSEDDAQRDREHACTAYWLVDVAAPKRPWIRQLVGQCEEDMRDVHAVVDARTMTFSFGNQSMYTANQSSNNTVIGLDPLRLVETSHTFARDDEHSTTWNWDNFAGTVENERNFCEGKRPPDAGAHDRESDQADVEAQAVLIPEVSLPPAFLAGGWKTTGLGRCAARVGGDHGFTVHGAKGTAADSSMRVVFASADELFIEVTDNRFVSGAKTWVKDDHVEIWAAAPDNWCVDPGEKPSARQWGIRVTDGRSRRVRRADRDATGRGRARGKRDSPAGDVRRGHVAAPAVHGRVQRQRRRRTAETPHRHQRAGVRPVVDVR